MSIRIGDYFRTIPEIQAIDMANKAQLADTIAYFKKSQQYDTGNIMGSIRSNITPAVCKAMNPKISREDVKEGLLAGINQFAFKEVLGYFKDTSHFDKCNDNGNKLEKGLKLWWAFAGRDVIEKVKNTMTSMATDSNFRDNIKALTTALQGKNKAQRYEELLK